MIYMLKASASGFRLADPSKRANYAIAVTVPSWLNPGEGELT